MSVTSATMTSSGTLVLSHTIVRSSELPAPGSPKGEDDFSTFNVEIIHSFRQVFCRLHFLNFFSPGQFPFPLAYFQQATPSSRAELSLASTTLDVLFYYYTAMSEHRTRHIG